MRRSRIVGSRRRHRLAAPRCLAWALFVALGAASAPAWAQPQDDPEPLAASSASSEAELDSDLAQGPGDVDELEVNAGAAIDDPDPRSGTLEISLIADLAARLEEVSGFAVDRDGNVLDADDPGLSLQARIGFGFEMAQRWAIPLRATVEFEGDVYRGDVLGESALAGVSMPGSEEATADVRKAYGRVSIGPFLTVGGGRMTSHWGLGLLANDGAHGWEPGSAAFTDPRGGDVVDRFLVATGPVGPLALTIAGFYDRQINDDAMLPGDDGNQFGLALRAGDEALANGGLYIVRRDQTAGDGDTLQVTVVDLAGSIPFALGDAGDPTLTVAAELAYVTGETTLAPTFEDPTHDLGQLGLALRGTLDAGAWGVVLDFLYASGDQNFDDAEQNAFKTDVNYELGLLMHRYVMRGITGRAPVKASDPALVGVPSPDLDRYPSRGAISNTVAFFPRGYWTPFDGFELYGGPLFAFTDVAFADPLATRTAGGDARNAYEGEPGLFLGTEVDLGVRYRVELWLTELTAGLEGAVFVPGSALADENGDLPEPIWGGRALLQYRF